MSIGGISPYAAYSYTPPQPPDISELGAMDVSDMGMDFDNNDLAPVDFSQAISIQNQDNVIPISSAEGARGSDQDSFRRDHSTAQQDLREIQAAMIGFSPMRMWELNGMI